MTITIIGSTNSVTDNTDNDAALTLGAGDVLIVSGSGYVLEQSTSSNAIYSFLDGVNVIVDGYVATAADPNDFAAISLIGNSGNLTVNGTVLGSVDVEGPTSTVSINGTVSDWLAVTGDNSDLTVNGRVASVALAGDGSTATIGVNGHAGYLQLLNNSDNVKITLYGQAGGIQLNPTSTAAMHIMSTGLVTGFGIVLGGDGDTMVCNGTIDPDDGYNAITVEPTNTRITVGAAGTITGYIQYEDGASGNLLTNNGLITNDLPTSLAVSLGNGNTLRNHGTIDSTGGATLDLAGSVLINTGTLSSDASVIILDGGSNVIVNTGLIDGFMEDLGDSSSSVTVRNSGSWTGEVIKTTLGNDQFFNTGHISGNLILRDGNDSYVGTKGQIDSVDGGAGNDTITGGADDDYLIGGAGADIIDGRGGTNTADYGSSTQGVSVNLQLHILSGGDATGDKLSRIQNVDGTNHADVLTGNGADNVFEGFAAPDSLLGNTGDDTLDGGDGNDILNGGVGSDTLIGGLLQDTIAGGPDADYFVYNSVADSSGTKYDIISDFNVGDDFFDLSVKVTGFDTAVTGVLLRTSSITADMHFALAGHLNAHHAILVTANTGNLSGHTFLVVDANGTAGFTAADMLIDVTGVVGTITIANFV